MAWIWLPGVASSSLNWRVFIALCALPTLIVFFMRLFIAEESPYYLLRKHKFQKLQEVLQKIAKLNKVSFLSVELERPSQNLMDIDESVNSVANDRHQDGMVSLSPVRELLADEKWKVTVPLWSIWFFLALGYWGVTIFLPSYFIDIGLNPYETFFVMVAAEIPGLLLTMFLMRSTNGGDVSRAASSSWFSCNTVKSRVNLIAGYELLTAFCLIPFIIDNAIGYMTPHNC